MGEQKKLIQETPALQLYFHERITEAFKHQNIQADDHVAFYLVNLLSQFAPAEKIQKDEDGDEIPLAILFCRAQSESPEAKARLLKYLGDFSLFISGFFQDSLNRKLVDLDYYVAMGEGAYSQLSSLPIFKKQSDVFNLIFSELAGRFVQWVDVISEVSEETHITRHQDLLRLYEKFLRTGSDRMREMLSRQGIFPNKEWMTKYSH